MDMMLNLLPGWKAIHANYSRRLVVGLDLGQSQDPTALSVIEAVRMPSPMWKANDAAKTWRQQTFEKFNVVHLERLRLGMNYNLQCAHVGAILARPELAGAKLYIDETGVGKAVGDMFDKAGLRPTRIVITGGQDITRAGSNTWHVPKIQLISLLEARLHSSELRLAHNLVEAPALIDEMKNFHRYVSEAGRTTYSARVGAHDDLVLSVAIALFGCLNQNSVTREELRI